MLSLRSFFWSSPFKALLHIRDTCAEVLHFKFRRWRTCWYDNGSLIMNHFLGVWLVYFIVRVPRHAHSDYCSWHSVAPLSAHDTPPLVRGCGHGLRTGDADKESAPGTSASHSSDPQEHGSTKLRAHRYLNLRNGSIISIHFIKQFPIMHHSPVSCLESVVDISR